MKQKFFGKLVLLWFSLFFFAAARAQTPTIVGASNITASSATINWVQQTGTSYTLSVYTNDAYTALFANYSGLTAGAKDLTGLTAGQVYYYKVISSTGTATESFTAQNSYTPINATGFTDDVIANGIAAPASSTTNTVTSTSNTNLVLTSADFQPNSSIAANSNGLPLNRAVANTTAGQSFFLQDYATSNTLRISSNGSTGTLTLSKPVAMTNLYIANAGGYSDVTFTAEVQFLNPYTNVVYTQTVTGLTASDLANSTTNVLRSGIPYVVRTSTNTAASDVRNMHALTINIDTDKQNYLVTGVKFTKTASVQSTAVLNIFALAGKVATPVCTAPNIPVATAPSNVSVCGYSIAAIALSGTPSGVTFDISGGTAIGLPDQTGVTTIPAFTATATGTSTITVTPKAYGCTGAPVTFTITVNAIPAAPTASAQAVYNGTVASLTAIGSNLQWYVASTGGSALASTTAVTTGTYYVSQTLNGCESTRTAVAITATSVRYVKPTASGTADGTSWANASSDLQAMVNTTGVQQIWVAVGTYTTASNGLVMKNNVAIYGGFSGTETAPSQRNWTTNITTLNGNNSHNVIYNDFTTATALGATAVLDGFTITRGYNNNLGGGIYNHYASPTLTNLTITGNSSTNGGGICNYYSSSPTITNVTISGNTATSGGGVCNYYSSSPTITNVTISGNTATGFGSAIYNNTSCSPVLTNVIISGNTTSSNGGGTIYNYNNSSPTLINVTISGNNSYVMTNNGQISNGNIVLRNTLIYGNESGILDYNNSGYPVTRYNSLVQGLTDTSNGNITGTTDPLFTNAPAYSTAPFTGGNYSLLPCSPVINAGSNSYVATDITTDLAGNARIYNTTVDMGAYELQQQSFTPSAPTASAQNLCTGNTVTNLTATGSNLQWYTASTGGSALATTAVLATGTYYVSQTLNGCESTRTSVAVTINTTAAPTASAQSFCNSGTVANLTATGTALQWYSASTGGSALATTTALAAGTYYVSQTLNGCESTRTSVAVTINTTAAPTASSQSFCNSGTVANLAATGTALKWYTVSTGGSALATTTALSTGTYYVSQTLNSCESTRTAVAVTINVTAAPTASAQSFCNSATVASLTATGTALKWYTASTGGSALASTTAVATGTYYVSQTLDSCESTRAAVVVTINVTAAPTASAQTYCNGATIASLVATGSNLQWYAASTGGSALATTTVLATGTYYVSQTLNGCEGTRTAVTVTINTTAVPTASAQTYCNGATVASLTATGTALKWYTVSTGGSALATTTTLATGTYYVSQTLNGCESTRTSVAVTVNTTAAPTASAQTYTYGTTVASLVATGTNLQWYVASTGGSALAATTALNTATYYVSQTANGCESTRTAVSISITYPVRYVKSTATGTGDGTSWANASADIQAMINATSVQQVWIASGTYYPTGNGYAMKNSVAVYGGFTGTETELSQRNWVTNVTTFSGNNERQVIYNNFTNSTALTATAVLDGFTLTGGISANSGEVYNVYASPTLNNLNIRGNGGAGLFNINSSPTLNNVAINGSNAGVYNSASLPTFNNVTISGNSNYAMYNDGASKPILNNVTISGNKGYAIYSTNTANAPVLHNTLIYGNEYGVSGGTPTYYYSLVQGVTGTTNGNINGNTSNPLFVSAPAYTTAPFIGGDYSLLPCSPVINAGSNSYIASGITTDLAGNARIYSTTVDMGAYEWQGGTTATPTASAQSFCNSATVASLVATGSNLQWYATSTGGSALAATTALSTDTYYVSQTLSGCVSARTAVTVTINATAAPTASAQSFCGSNTVANLTATGSNLKWYAASTGGSALATTTTLATGTYYVSQTLNGCESTRISVAVTLTGKTWTGTTNNDWNTGSNWCGNTLPTATDDITIPVTSNNPVIASGIAYAHNLTIGEGATLTVATGATLDVKNILSVNATGTLTVQDNGALIQGPATATNANSGNIVFHKKGSTLYRLDYTLWSSPVVGQNIGLFSPATASNRFYVYKTVTDVYATITASATDFAQAKAYLIRMPNVNATLAGYNEGTTATQFEGVFTGQPGNGTITYALSAEGNRFNAVGNPYPSPINLSDFLTANSSVIDGASGVYFWRKKNDGTSSSYATLTLAAFTANPATGGGSENDQFYVYDQTTGSDNWLLAPGQGFLVKGLSGVTNPVLTFTNEMRRPTPGSTQSFFRHGANTASRLWLNLNAAETGAASQAAIAYMDQTTLALDYGYDAKKFTEPNTVALYSLAESTPLTIQARPSFTNTDVVPMGFVAPTAGTYTISIDHSNGVFAEGQTVYIRDNAEGIIRNLNGRSYTFATEAGTFETRFDVLYSTEALGTDTPVVDANAIAVFKQGNTIQVNTGNVMMNGVTIYDIRGRKIYSVDNINNTQTAITNLAAEQQVLIVEINTVKGKVSKRIVF